MPNYIRAGVKISVSRCYGVMRPDLKFLVQIFITVYREGQRPSVKRDLSCVGVWGFFLYTVFVFMSACFSKSMILSLIVQNVKK